MKSWTPGDLTRKKMEEIRRLHLYPSSRAAKERRKNTVRDSDPGERMYPPAKKTERPQVRIILPLFLRIILWLTKDGNNIEEIRKRAVYMSCFINHYFSDLLITFAYDKKEPPAFGSSLIFSFLITTLIKKYQPWMHLSFVKFFIDSIFIIGAEQKPNSVCLTYWSHQ